MLQGYRPSIPITTSAQKTAMVASSKLLLAPTVKLHGSVAIIFNPYKNFVYSSQLHTIIFSTERSSGTKVCSGTEGRPSTTEAAMWDADQTLYVVLPRNKHSACKQRVLSVRIRDSVA